MTDHDWLRVFIKDCEEEDQRYARQVKDDELEKKTLHSFVVAVLNPYRSAIESIGEQLQELESLKASVDSLKSDLRTLASGIDSTAGTLSARRAARADAREFEVSAEVLAQLEQLVAASTVQTSTVPSVTIPAVGDTPRDTPYLAAKREVESSHRVPQDAGQSDNRTVRVRHP